MELSERQRKFCEWYVKTGNASESARQAGYSEKTAKEQGCIQLTKINIKEYIQQLSMPEQSKRIADAKEILQFLTNTMRGEVKDAFGLDPGLQDRIKAGVELAKRIVDTRTDLNDEKVEDDELSKSLKELGEKL